MSLFRTMSIDILNSERLSNCLFPEVVIYCLENDHLCMKRPKKDIWKSLTTSLSN